LCQQEFAPGSAVHRKGGVWLAAALGPGGPMDSRERKGIIYQFPEWLHLNISLSALPGAIKKTIRGSLFFLTVAKYSLLY
jgi:hypothetical protein